MNNPRYDLVANNCEHFARYVFQELGSRHFRHLLVRYHHIDWSGP